jgi:hypothetical protein
MLVGPGTIFILDSGEGVVEDRLLFLDAGVIDQLARATGRRGDCTRASVCLALSIHMSPPLTPGYSYCGESILMLSFVTAFMVRSSEHARSGPLIQLIYLDQRRASTDRPIQLHVQHEVRERGPQAHRTPDTLWIYYGGLYAGTCSAILTVKYFGIVYSAVACSGRP